MTEKQAAIEQLVLDLRSKRAEADVLRTWQAGMRIGNKLERRFEGTSRVWWSTRTYRTAEPLPRDVEAAFYSFVGFKANLLEDECRQITKRLEVLGSIPDSPVTGGSE